MSESGEAKSYLVECYSPDLWCRGSILVPADETVFCLFDGVEADVRAVSEEAGMPFERILESLRIDGRQRKERSET